MLSFFKKLTKIGISPDLTYEEKRKISITNVLLIFGNIVNITYLIDHLFSKDYSHILFDIPIIIAFPLGFFFNFIKKHSLTIWSLAFFIPLHLLISSLTYGNLGYDYILIAFCFIIYILIEKRVGLVILTLYILCCFLVMNIEISFFKELFKNVEKEPYYYYYINASIGFILSIIAISLFKRENKRYFKLADTQNTKITNQKKEIEQQNIILSDINTELEKTNKSKDKFFSIISHDLISPFNSILGLLELLYSEYDEYSDKDRKEIISQVSGVADNTHSLLINILSWAKSQIGNIEINQEKIKLNSFVEEAIKPYMFYANQKKLEININIHEDIVINADTPTIETVIRNIFNNAVKFTSINGSINIGAETAENHILISIKDNGVGIEQKFINKLFSIDENHSTIGTNNEKGTGLGLLLCKEFVELNGGEIFVESEKGLGSTFSFTLPV